MSDTEYRAHKRAMMISRPLRPSAAEVMSRAANVAALGVPTDGSVDVTEGLQGAWTNHGLIYLPPGTYKTSATLIGPATDGAGRWRQECGWNCRSAGSENLKITFQAARSIV